MPPHFVPDAEMGEGGTALPRGFAQDWIHGHVESGLYIGQGVQEPLGRR